MILFAMQQIRTGWYDQRIKVSKMIHDVTLLYRYHVENWYQFVWPIRNIFIWCRLFHGSRLGQLVEEITIPNITLLSGIRWTCWICVQSLYDMLFDMICRWIDSPGHIEEARFLWYHSYVTFQCECYQWSICCVWYVAAIWWPQNPDTFFGLSRMHMLNEWLWQLNSHTRVA